MSDPGRPATGGNGSARPPTLENFAPQNKRGRPRSAGSHLCDRCQQHVAKIRVRWPDGAVCGACFTQATHTYGTCPDCREDRMLPGRSPATGEPICRDCAGIATDLSCTRCEREAERFRAGLCVRCALADDLTAVLKPGEDLRLHRLISLLTETGRPESIYTYMRPGTKARQLLESIGNRTLALTHEAFDALPRSAAAEHLRALLVHHRMMTARGNENLARFEQWIAARIDALPDDGTSRLIERFATWHHLKRVRARAADPETNLETVTHAAKQDITEAGKFLLWLRQHHNAGADDLQQSHVDDYLSSGPSTRKAVRNFVRWLNRQQSGRPSGLDAPFRSAQSIPMITQTQRRELVRNCLEHHHVVRSTRLAGLILLLWAHPLNKIVMLRRDHLTTTPEGMLIKLGMTPAAVPAALTEMFWQQSQNPGNRNTANTGTDWLFPGTRAGRHLHPGTLAERLRVLGIDAQRARNATLRDLTQEVDARTLMDLLGYSPGIIAQHAARAAVPMSDYVALKNSGR
ncbi:hypothetical protein [Sinomonas terrae]|uniref:Recombinase XerD n=1 Tax=Sinomonas terrae TaxID=2908838 RepID=A0ABS9U775_9MICC|nr:hypothetical protein [Sinomonas terrae]MCH6472516.1 hypothetical protein [Sinomonas terrae]MCH6472535.1 hypothetical protein [Sinomonas terrae]